MNEIMSTALILAENAPQTGDNFPKGILFAIIGAAVLLAVGSIVFAKKKDDDDEK